MNENLRLLEDFDNGRNVNVGVDLPFFRKEEVKPDLNLLISSFRDHFLSLNYQQEPSVPIISGIDPSVFVVGSTTSVFKKYILEDLSINKPGIFTIQNCIRCRNIDTLLDDDSLPKYGSCFTEMGLIAPYDMFYPATIDALNFFREKLSIPDQKLLIRVSSLDDDLLDFCKREVPDIKLEIDTEKISYYRHKIGIDGILGRNFNLAIQDDKTKEFSDVGNVIIFNNDNKPHFIEIGFGDSTIAKQLYSLQHVQDCHPLTDKGKIKNKFVKRKLEDTIFTSLNLLHEDLLPYGQSNQSRILKKYIKSLSYFRSKCDMTVADLFEIISTFDKREFPNSNNKEVINLMFTYLQDFENYLYKNKYLSDFEKKIRDVVLT